MELVVVTGSYDSLVQGFSVDALDPEGKGLRRKFHEEGHSGCVRSIACGGRYLATGGNDETIKLYDMRRNIEIGTLLQQEGSITWLTFHRDHLLLSASEDGTICVWKCGDPWSCLCTLTGHKYAVTCVSVHPSGKLALSVGKDRTVRAWDLTNFRAAFRLRLPKAADLVVWSPIGDQYALSVQKDITVYDVSTGECTVTIDVGRQVNCFIFIQDDVLAVGSENSHIDVFSTASGSLLASLEGHTSRLKGLGLSPAADLLFSVSSDGCVRAWKLRDPLMESSCVSTVNTGLRLTCLTVVPPDSLLRELNEPMQGLSSGDKSTLSGEEPFDETGASENSSTPQSLSHKETSKQRSRSREKSCRNKRGQKGRTQSALQGRSRRKVIKKIKKLGYDVTNGRRTRTVRFISGKLSKRRFLAYKELLLTRKKNCVKKQLHTSS